MILVVIGRSEYDGRYWRTALQRHLPDDECIVLPEESFDRTAIDIAVVAAPPPGSLQDLPGLQFIQSLWVGVDGLLATLPPGVPVARLVDPSMTRFIVESAVLSVLWIHRRMPEYAAQQDAGVWRQLPQPRADKRKVGVLGLGRLGRAAAAALAGFGFEVWGWSSRRAEIPGVRCLAGAEEFSQLLGNSQILVNLLPLTDQTRGILNGRALAALPNGATLINLARGAHLVERDLLEALETGQIFHAVLDVFSVEPLPRAHEFWSHPGVTITPHVAGPSDPESAALIACAAIRAFRRGEPVPNLVDRGRGY